LLLPREAELSDMARTIRPQIPDLHESQPIILLVDDDLDARHMLALMLETRGAKVRHVGTAADALDSMLRRRPDILLADLGMSGEDGYSLIRRWRTHEGATNGHVMAIAVTAYASARDKQMALAAGFDRHIAKPVDADELVRVIVALQAIDQRSRN
jgi:CheY-like chemotaxis protein